MGFSFIDPNSTLLMSNTKQTNPKSFAKIDSSKSLIRNTVRTVPWASILHLTSTMTTDMNSTGGNFRHMLLPDGVLVNVVAVAQVQLLVLLLRHG